MPSAYQVVAVDYDGTLTTEPRPDPEVLEAVAATRDAGLAVVLVTGRILSELRTDFPEVDDVFDAIVAENGAVLVDRQGTRDLAEPVDPELAASLAHRDVPLRHGRVLLACHASSAPVALEEIGRLGLDCQLVRNRSALMILPGGVTKGTGLAEALGDLGISRHSTVAIGDAENDLPLLEDCELGVAVANAVDSLKQRAELVLEHADGDGVIELLRGPVLTGAMRVPPRNWQLQLGRTPGGRSVRIPASQVNLLVTGGSCSGKSYFTGLVAEQLVQLGYNLLLIDREGDHVDLAERRGVVRLGGSVELPSAAQLTQLLRHRFGSVVLDVSLWDIDAQREYLQSVVPAVLAQRAVTGVPHWIFVDEAHHLLGDETWHDRMPTTGDTGYCYTTYRPSALPAAVHERIDYVVATRGGHDGVDDVAALLAGLTGLGADDLTVRLGGDRGSALLVQADAHADPVPFAVAERVTGHVRHWHKYLDGHLDPSLRFYFHSTGQVAANLREFHRLLATCPPETVRFHSRRGDFSRWIVNVLQDHELAAAVEPIEARGHDADGESTRAAIRAAVESRYLE